MRKIVLGMVFFLLMIPLVSALSIDLVQTDPAPVIAGDYADVTVRISSDDADDVSDSLTLVLEETPYIFAVESPRYSLGAIYGGETLTRTIRVFFSEELPQGFLDITFILDDNGFETSREVPVYVLDAETLPDLYIGDVETTPNELLADTQDNVLEVTLQNLGDKDAELVNAELFVFAQDGSVSDSITPSYSYSFIDSVASIGKGQEALLEFGLDVEDNVLADVPAILSLRYRAEKSVGSSYDIYYKNISFAIPITDAPLLTVDSVEALDAFTPGTTENRIRVGIRNKGNEDADEVRIRVVPDISYPFILERTTEYVASTIEPGEMAYVEFRAEVLSDADAKTYATTVLLESLVGETRYSREDTINLAVQPGSTFSGKQIGFMILLFVIGISSWLGYRRYRLQQIKAKKK